MSEKVKDLEMKIYELTRQLHELRKDEPLTEVDNYSFDTLTGKVTLKELFAGHDQLLAIHNMGQGCRYCTLWGDGLNGFLPHLESALSVVMLSKDSPQLQQKFANSRQWRMRMASHGGGAYQQEQVAGDGMDNAPGVVCYKLKDDLIYRAGASYFGPGDMYCSAWNFLALAGLSDSDWTPQYNYWLRPSELEDGGENVLA